MQNMKTIGDTTMFHFLLQPTLVYT